MSAATSPPPPAAANGHQLNGGGGAAGGSFDPDDPETQREMWRPPDIDQDMKEMDRRRRVDIILNSQMFREELERIIESQLNDGYLPASLSALQQVTELLAPNGGGAAGGGRSGSSRLATSAGPPINDIRGIDGLKYAKGEKALRCKLASVYRLVELYGWSMGIYNHITVSRVDFRFNSKG